MRVDIIEHALRRLGVAAHDEPATADQLAEAGPLLDDMFDMIKVEQGFKWEWTPDSAPAWAIRPLGDVLANDLAPSYRAPAPVTRASAIGRLRAISFPSDAEDRRDTNEDGVIDEAEELHGRRARFY